MSDNSAEAIVRRANQMITAPGFHGCSIHDEGPPLILAYAFDSGPNAEAFKAQLELLADGTGLQYMIENRRPNVVLERR